MDNAARETTLAEELERAARGISLEIANNHWAIATDHLLDRCKAVYELVAALERLTPPPEGRAGTL